MTRRQTLSLDGIEVGDIDLLPNPFRCMPEEVNIVDIMNLYAYELIMRAAADPGDARREVVKAAVKAAVKAEQHPVPVKAEEQVDRAEAFIPLIEEQMARALSKAATHLGVRATAGITRELKKPKSKRKKQLIFPVYKFVEDHGGSEVLTENSRNTYFVNNNTHMAYLRSSLSETLQNKAKQGQAKPKFSAKFKVMPYTDRCKFSGLRFKTQQVCLVVTFV